MNNKILSVVLVVGIAATGFAGISAADEGLFGEEMEKRIDALEDRFEARFDFDGEKRSQFGKRKGLKHLTDEEKTALESMTDEEKQAFFEGKKAEKKAEKEARKAVVDKLVAGESLTSAEETLRLEMLEKVSENEGKRSKPGSEIIAKILAGDELTSEEESKLQEMQAKHAERQLQRDAVDAIEDKIEAGEEISEEEQAFLDEMKSQKKGKKGGKKRGYRGEK